jgi:antitoxin PrlF
MFKRGLLIVRRPAGAAGRHLALKARERDYFGARRRPPYFIVRDSSTSSTMTTATVTSKGQITIPANVRLALQVQPGDRVEFVEVDPGRFEVVAATISVTELKGMFGKPARSVSIDEMNKAIAARGKAAR